MYKRQYKHLTFENLLSAHLRAKKQKAKKCEVLRFELNLENNLVNLLNKDVYKRQFYNC